MKYLIKEFHLDNYKSSPKYELMLFSEQEEAINNMSMEEYGKLYKDLRSLVLKRYWEHVNYHIQNRKFSPIQCNNCPEDKQMICIECWWSRTDKVSCYKCLSKGKFVNAESLQWKLCEPCLLQEPKFKSWLEEQKNKIEEQKNKIEEQKNKIEEQKNKIEEQE